MSDNVKQGIAEKLLTASMLVGRCWFRNLPYLRIATRDVSFSCRAKAEDTAARYSYVATGVGMLYPGCVEESNRREACLR